MRVVGIDGSPSGGGRTLTAIESVLAGATSKGGATECLALAESGAKDAIDRLASLQAGDGVVLGTPIHRASYSTPVKQLLDGMPRGQEDRDSPFRARAVALVGTGASLHHFLALNDMRNVLSSFFAAIVLPPGLYVPREGFDDDGRLLDSYSDQGFNLGGALFELGGAVGAGDYLPGLAPQV